MGSVSARELELGRPVAPVCGPVLFRHDSRLFSLELWPILARNLHRVVLRQFVFVVGALEEAALSGRRAGRQEKCRWTRKEGEKKGWGGNVLLNAFCFFLHFFRIVIITRKLTSVLFNSVLITSPLQSNTPTMPFI